ncbi:Serine/threonine-protein kinase ULK3 [Trichoplax sp. H2]|nr:Serine/threonine-protein kinase ULK3 [Trichoplax sp. H2]|eukprot:RDD46289.1 Serine/threonine-protein kinase ULK3 [Trichoplax sp. H2]
MATFPTVKNYIVTEKLGQGTYATVYKAYRTVGKREVVAIKCIQKRSLSKSASDNLITEISLMKELNHDHIVQLTDFQWDGKAIYLIMEYCSGGDLSKFIRFRKRLPEIVVKKFLRQLASALQFLRIRNISHMDLKPQNMLLSSQNDPVLKLADFGFAQYVMNEVDAKTLRGSPLYMAPEIICSGKYDAKADLWSAGIIMFEALFGVAPFASNSYAELEDKIRSSAEITLPSNANISASCRDLLISLLRRNPDERISFDNFFNHPFIDLEHMPSPECLAKSRDLFTEAVKRDNQNDLKGAAMYYTRGLEYFVPAIEYEKNPAKKDALRVRASEYLARAEELRRLLKSENVYANASIESPGTSLVKLYTNDNKMEEALLHLETAENYDNKEMYDAALHQYEKTLSKLLELAPDETDTAKRERLMIEIQRCMKRAEEIKLLNQMKQSDGLKLKIYDNEKLATNSRKFID